MELLFKTKKHQVQPAKDNKSINIDDVLHNFEFRRIDKNHLKINISGVWQDVFIAEDKNHYYVNAEGTTYHFDKVHSDGNDYGEGQSANEDIINVKPPMPGSIVKVLVEQGQKVSEGDGLIIVEAMKMETTIYTTIDGFVTEINVSTGEQVDADKVLMVVEKEKGTE